MPQINSLVLFPSREEGELKFGIVREVWEQTSDWPRYRRYNKYTVETVHGKYHECFEAETILLVEDASNMQLDLNEFLLANIQDIIKNLVIYSQQIAREESRPHVIG